MPAPKGHAPYNVNGEGGRPKKYTEEFINKEAAALLLWIKKDKGNIWFERFAFERGYPAKNFQAWADENERFSEALEMAKLRQKIVLMENGLTKRFNFNMCQLLLGWEYGIFPKQQTQISGDSQSPLSVFLNQAIDQSKDLVDESKDS